MATLLSEIIRHSGNIREWQETGTMMTQISVRCAGTRGSTPGIRNFFIGFRVVRFSQLYENLNISYQELRVRGDRSFTRSAAAIEIASRLDMPWNLLTVFQAVPEPLRDVMYDLIAQNRYQLFGKKEQCMLPSDELRQRFLEQLPG
jgi:hypothetical protein